MQTSGISVKARRGSQEEDIDIVDLDEDELYDVLIDMDKEEIISLVQLMAEWITVTVEEGQP